MLSVGVADGGGVYVIGLGLNKIEVVGPDGPDGANPKG